MDTPNLPKATIRKSAKEQKKQKEQKEQKKRATVTLIKHTSRLLKV